MLPVQGLHFEWQVVINGLENYVLSVPLPPDYLLYDRLSLTWQINIIGILGQNSTQLGPFITQRCFMHYKNKRTEV